MKGKKKKRSAAIFTLGAHVPSEPKRETGEKPTSRSTAPTEKAGKQLACRQTIRREAREIIWHPNSAIT